MHFTKDFPHWENAKRFIQGNSPTTAVLTDPFLDQANQVESHHKTSDSSSSQVLMCQEEIRISTRTTDYSQKEGSSSKKPTTQPTPPPNDPLQIERPMKKTIKPPSKNILRKSAYNPYARATQAYNIVEDLA